MSTNANDLNNHPNVPDAVNSPTDVNHDAKQPSAESTHDTKIPGADGLAKTTEKAYSVFTKNEKWIIVSVASFAGLFSPLTANIYFPAIPTIAADFHKSTELINLTVTVYMIMQGVSPMFWGTLADRWGRRPIFLACILVLAVSCVGLALVPTDAYWLLMLLRCIQAAGSASTIALGAGVIGDIATRAERGGFFGLYNLGPMVGPAIGPVIGGGLADGLGWRSIFWFLCIASAFCLIAMVLFLPETLRCIVGDGSIVPSPLYRPLIPIVGRHRPKNATIEKPPMRPPSNPLRLLTYPDLVLLLIFNGIIYAVFYAVTATISTLFKTSYPFLSETSIGLCFLAIGGGMFSGSLATGKLLDRDYQIVRKQMLRKIQDDPEKKLDSQDVTRDDVFEIERARMRTVPLYLAVFIACCMGYGWCLQERVSLAGPLILQFAIGWFIISIQTAVSTLLVDLVPTQGSSVTACNNIVRCLLGAGSVSVIDLIINAIGTGWTYVLLGGICCLTYPVMRLGMHIGPRCRAQRRRLAELSAQNT
ncbi:hypothetical protein PLICRDRAFT_35485 [Plicaturopsis crispa FD-325 SS-3]|nr:hypothetical protein PLICRDRAFT_35485 [Plicaturopsis crispa FD-325 SS-3]